MRNIDADVVILGGGTAGMNAFRAARKYTDNVYLVEDHHFGTTCARVGCMPSKLLISAADAAYYAQNMDEFGVHLEGDIRIDGKEVMHRVKSERDRFVGFVLEDIESFPDDKKILGKAKFVNEHLIQVDDSVLLHAKRVVIATGSRPYFLPEWQAFGDKVIVNDDVFEWDDLPKSVAVIGLGVIGLELGQALYRLGVNVHCFVRSGRMGLISDPVVLEKAKEIFGSELNIHFNTTPDFELNGDKIVLRFTENNEIKELTFDYVLPTQGRIPNIDDIGLEHLDIEVDKNGVPIVKNKHTMQTSIEHIFIAGDASNERLLLHEASDQGKIAGENAGSFPDIQHGLRRSMLGIIFSDPQIASVGERWIDIQQRLQQQADSVVVGEVSFHNQGRSRVMLVNKGYLRLYADKKTGKFLGVEMCAPAAEHLAHLLAWAHQQEMTIEKMLTMPFYHPTIEEGLRTALRDAQRQIEI